jgi:hypothetical protein
MDLDPGAAVGISKPFSLFFDLLLQTIIFLKEEEACCHFTAHIVS